MKKIALLFIVLIVFSGNRVLADTNNDLEAHKHSIVYIKYVADIDNGYQLINHGTGFFIDNTHVMTASHAVHFKQDAKEKYIRLYFQESSEFRTSVDATVVYDDTFNDIAILKVVDSALSITMDKVEPLKIVANETPNNNDALTIIGFPYDHVKENNPNVVNLVTSDSIYSVSKGKFEGKYGNQLLATNKVRGGYSGSPVLNENGHVVGLARAKIDATEEVVFIPLDILIKDIQDSKI